SAASNFRFFHSNSGANSSNCRNINIFSENLVMRFLFTAFMQKIIHFGYFFYQKMAKFRKIFYKKIGKNCRVGCARARAPVAPRMSRVREFKNFGGSDNCVQDSTKVQYKSTVQ